jgi:hypothetical protein
MNIIIIEHADFRLKIRTVYSSMNAFLDLYQRAKERNTIDYFSTSYWCSDKLNKFEILEPISGICKENSIDSVDYPVFLEDQSYNFMIEFLADISNVGIYSKTKEIENAFRTDKTKFDANLLSGNIKFKGNIGSFDLNICYDRGTIPTIVVFKFEIFSTQLSFKKQFPIMVKDIDSIYPRLVIDYMKPTHHFFESTPGTYHNVIWWIAFENIFKNILKNIHIIFEHTYSAQVAGKVRKVKSEINEPAPEQSEELTIYKGDPNKQFELPGSLILKNNYENQVVKFVLKDVIKKFEHIYKLVTNTAAGKRMTNSYRAQLEYVHKALSGVTTHPFYRELSDIVAVKKITHVLKEKTGYVDLLNDWNKLKGGYKLFEGVFKIELKDTAYVYRLWCFLGMVEIIRLSGAKQVKVIKVPEVMPEHFLALADKDAHACIVFEDRNGNKIELYHELKYDEDFSDGSGTFSGPVRPDIVLRIRKADLPDDLYLTYIFNSRYSVRESEDNKYPDLPTLESLAEMHEYKDAVYFSDRKNGKLRKEINGGFVLYPGTGKLKQFMHMRESMAPDAGGFPFSPGADVTNVLLEDLISHIIHTDGTTLLKDTTPHKGMEHKDDTIMLILYIKKSETALIDYLKTTDTPVLEHKSFPPALGENRLRFVAVYIEGTGISALYEIEHFNWKSRKDVYPPDHNLFRNETRKCLVLKLKNKRVLDTPLQIKGVINNDRYTKLEYFNNPVNGFIKTISERETITRNHNS